jgi:hypothetical protein
VDPRCGDESVQTAVPRERRVKQFRNGFRLRRVADQPGYCVAVRGSRTQFGLSGLYPRAIAALDKYRPARGDDRARRSKANARRAACDRNDGRMVAVVIHAGRHGIWIRHRHSS